MIMGGRVNTIKMVEFPASELLGKTGGYCLEDGLPALVSG